MEFTKPVSMALTTTSNATPTAVATATVTTTVLAAITNLQQVSSFHKKMHMYQRIPTFKPNLVIKF